MRCRDLHHHFAVLLGFHHLQNVVAIRVRILLRIEIGYQRFDQADRQRELFILHQR